MNAKEMFRVWMDDPYYDDATKAELKEIEGNDMEKTGKCGECSSKCQ